MFCIFSIFRHNKQVRGFLTLNGSQDCFTSLFLGLLRALALVLLTTAALEPSVAQFADSSETEGIRGRVLNSATHEPISGVLVLSPDNHFATRTDTQGRFEFTASKREPAPSAPAGNTGTAGATEGGEFHEGSWPVILAARKPGFLEGSNTSALDLAHHAGAVTLFLVPEGVIAGHLSFPGSEAPDKIQLQLFRRVVHEGLAQWVPAGNTVSRSDGDFRFAELPAGTYKLLTRELLERDPFNTSAQEQQYGYPPTYYQEADDLASAAEIVVSPGDTAEVRLSLAKQSYYRVQIALVNPPSADFAMNINASRQKGRLGPGYTLAYNSGSRKIEGWLPNGTYSLEAESSGQAPMAGGTTLFVKGGPVADASLQLLPASSISVDVNEEFSSKEPEGSTAFTNDSQGGTQRALALRGPRRYLNVSLESADEFSTGRTGFLRPPAGPDDNTFQLEGVLPGRYWVRVQSSRGYVASVRAGTTNLLREPLVVGAGSSAGPIEITMRDDSAQIEGQVEGIRPAPVDSQPPVLPPAFVYCVPTLDGSGQFTEIGAAGDGSFSSQPLPPGEYRVLAFDHRQTDLEYRNPEAMKLYDNQGAIVRVAAGQTEHVTLQVIPTPEGSQ